MPELSPELTDRVIDALKDDKAALKTCGLVCTQWFPRSRFHLFSAVTLQVGHGRFHARSIPDNMETFLDLLSTASFDILAAIRVLKLSYRNGEFLAKEHLLQFASCLQLTDLVINLPSMYYEHPYSLVPSLHAQLALVGPNFSSLSTFSLRFPVSSMCGLLDVLGSMPTVENLWLGGNDIEALEAAVPGPFPAFPERLRCLEMHVLRGAELFFGHLLSLPALPLLQTITVDNDEMEMNATAPIAVYLQRAGHALESLSLTIWIESGSFEELALQSCTNLRHFSLMTFMSDQPSTYLFDLLSAVSSSELVTVKLEFAMRELEFSAEALDQALAHRRFRNLRNFSLKGSNSLLTPESAAIHQVKGFDILRPRGNISRVSGDKQLPAAISASIERIQGVHLARFNERDNFAPSY
ncbi:hypothetical protein FB451DRAFT_1558359 [Mycena latifolia]|nr:hypothetical protein FB451DRAFT_1558359 [Mycena latifolia]